MVIHILKKNGELDWDNYNKFIKAKYSNTNVLREKPPPFTEEELKDMELPQDLFIYLTKVSRGMYIEGYSTKFIYTIKTIDSGISIKNGNYILPGYYDDDNEIEDYGFIPISNVETCTADPMRFTYLFNDCVYHDVTNYNHDSNITLKIIANTFTEYIINSFKKEKMEKHYTEYYKFYKFYNDFEL